MALVPAVAMAIVGCGGPSAERPNAQSPERQSETEYDLARDLFQKGRQREALDHAQKAAQLDDQNAKAHYMVAAVLLSFCSTNRGLTAPDCKLADVERSLKASLAIEPDFRDAKNTLGSVLINERKYKEAIEVLAPLTRDPAYVQSYLAWGNLGWAQTEAGQLEAAVTSLRNAVSAEPRFCVGHYRLGVALEKQRAFTEAEQSLSSAVSSDPGCAELQDAWEARARVRLKLDRVDDARRDFARCAEISKETSTGQRCVREVARLGGGQAESGRAFGTANPKHTRQT